MASFEKTNDKQKMLRIIKAAKVFFDNYEKIEEAVIRWAPWENLEESLTPYFKKNGFLNVEYRELKDSIEAARFSLYRSDLGLDANRIIENIISFASNIAFDENLRIFEKHLRDGENVPNELSDYDTKETFRLKRMEITAILDTHIKSLINKSGILVESSSDANKNKNLYTKNNEQNINGMIGKESTKTLNYEEHHDFLRKIAMNVFYLVSEPKNMARFREQLKLFRNKVAEHEEEMKKIEQNFKSNIALQKAAKEFDEKLAQEPKNEHGWGALEFKLETTNGWGLLDDFKEYVCYGKFWGPIHKSVDLVSYLEYFPPDTLNFIGRRPNNSEILLCDYALLSIIHDDFIDEKPIFFTPATETQWMFKIQGRCSCLFHIQQGRTQGVKDTQAWIERNFKSVKQDLARKITPEVGGKKQNDKSEKTKSTYLCSKSISELITQHESHTLEFKETLQYDIHTNKADNKVLSSSLKTIAAFLNTNGGTLLIGVSDSGEVKGITRDISALGKNANNDRFELKIRDCISGQNSRFDPAATGNVNISFEELHEGTICRVDVQPLANTIILNFDNEVYIRDGNRTIKLQGRALTDCIQQRAN